MKMLLEHVEIVYPGLLKNLAGTHLQKIFIIKTILDSYLFTFDIFLKIEHPLQWCISTKTVLLFKAMFNIIVAEGHYCLETS